MRIKERVRSSRTVRTIGAENNSWQNKIKKLEQTKTAGQITGGNIWTEQKSLKT